MLPNLDHNHVRKRPLAGHNHVRKRPLEHRADLDVYACSFPLPPL